MNIIMKSLKDLAKKKLRTGINFLRERVYNML